MKKYCLPFVWFVCLLLTACASWAPSVAVDDAPDKSMAYLFGDFQIRTLSKSTQHYQSFGLNFSCADGNSYLVKLKAASTLQVIPVKPSKCSLTELVFVDEGGQIKMRESFVPDFLRNIDLKQGTAYYIGDYKGEAWATSQILKIRYSWRITGLKDSYAETAKKLRSVFPKFSDFSTGNLLDGAVLPPTTPSVLEPG